MKRLQLVENTVDGYARGVRDAIAQGAGSILFDPVTPEALGVMDALQGQINVPLYVPDGSDDVPANVRVVGDDRPDLTVLCEPDGEKLSGLLMRHVNDRDVNLLAGRTNCCCVDRPLFLISIPKSGTHLLFRLARALGYRQGGEMSGNARPGCWYYLEYSNSHTGCRDFFVDTVRRSPFGNRHHPFAKTPALFIYRDPMDIVVSEANYYHVKGKTAFWGCFSGMDFGERLLRLIDDPNLLGSIRDRVNAFEPWLRFPNVIPLSFEELVGEKGGGDREMQERLVWSLQLKLHIPGDSAQLCGDLYDTTAPTFNRGRAGAGRAEFSQEALAKFASLDQDFMTSFGYSMDSAGLSARVDEFRQKSFLCGWDAPALPPYMMDDGYLGWNIIAHDGKYHAVPRSLGECDLSRHDPDRPWLPCSEHLDDLRLMLTLGLRRYCDNMSELQLFSKGKRLNKPNKVIRFLVAVRRKVTGRWFKPGDLSTSDSIRLLLAKNGQSIWWANGVFLYSDAGISRDDISENSLPSLLAEGRVRWALAPEKLTCK